MKKIMMLAIALIMMLSTMAVMADGGKEFTITPKVAMNVALDGETRSMAGNQYGLLVEGEFNRLIPANAGTIGLEIGYFGGSGNELNLCQPWEDSYNDYFVEYYLNQNIKAKTTSIPIMATYKYTIDPNNGFYVKAGLGVSINKLKTKGDASLEYYAIDRNTLQVFEYGNEVNKGYYDRSKTKTNIAFQLGVGCKFTNNLNAELLYTNYGKFDFDNLTFNDNDTLKSSNIQFNLGYSF